MKLNVGVIFGGKSVEHEASILTAIQAISHIDNEKYEVIPIYITKDLEWYTGGCLKFLDTFKDFDLIKRYAKRVILLLQNLFGLGKDFIEIRRKNCLSRLMN